MALHPLAFIGVGIMVSGMSWWIGGNLTLFFYLGLLMLIWGVGRYVVEYVIRKPTSSDEHRVAKRLEGRTYACPYCHAQLHAMVRFCPSCGARLR